MITEKEKEQLREEIQRRFNKAQVDIKVFDISSQLDNTLSYSENRNIILEQIKPLLPSENDLTNKEAKNLKEYYTFIDSQAQSQEDILSYEVLKNIKTIAIFGDCGSGKTALAYKILECFKAFKKCYFMKHPKPKLITEQGYFNLRNLEDLEKLQDCVIYLDEPQLYTSVYDKHTNLIFAKICSLARQRNITLILSSSDTRVFTKHNEAYFDLWLIKDVDYFSVKNGSRIKNIIKENCFIDPRGFTLNKNEFISWSRTIKEFNGKHEFILIQGWKDDLSTPYRL